MVDSEYLFKKIIWNAETYILIRLDFLTTFGTIGTFFQCRGIELGMSQLFSGFRGKNGYQLNALYVYSFTIRKF